MLRAVSGELRAERKVLRFKRPKRTVQPPSQETSSRSRKIKDFIIPKWANSEEQLSSLSAAPGGEVTAAGICERAV